MKLLLFDIDGTLLATNGAGTRAGSRAFEKMHGIKNSMDKVDAAGKTDPIIIKELYRNELERAHTQDEAEELWGYYVTYLREEIKSGELTVMPGVRELLKILSKRSNLALGLATGNIEEGTYIKLARASLEAYFSFGGYGSDFEIREELVRRAIERAHSHMNHAGGFEETYVIGVIRRLT